MRLANKHLILTDGVSNLGLATARRLLARGASISLIGRERVVLAEAAEALQPMTRLAHQQIGIAVADFGVRHDIQQAIGDLTRQLGPCDGLIAATHVFKSPPFHELDYAVIDLAMQSTYFGLVAAIQAVLPSMIARRSGAIVALTSLVGMVDSAGYAAYGPARLAVQGLIETLRVELRSFNVAVSMAYVEQGRSDVRSIETSAQALVKGISKGRPTISADWQGTFVMRVGRLLHPLIRRQLVRRRSQKPPLV